MNEHTETENYASPDDVELAELMTLAGARPAISPDRQARVYRNVEDEWLRATARPRQMKWAVPLALAASVLIAITILINVGGAPAQALGTVARIVADAPPGSQQFALNQTVHVGDTIETSSGQALSITLDERSSLRIAADTDLRLDREDSFTLLRGLVYADSGRLAGSNAGFTIHTALGSVTDIGTQFSVQYSEDEIGVAVREGRVDIASDDSTYSVIAGDRLIVRHDGYLQSDTVSPSDESWSWAVELAPDFDMESKSLLDFLEWAARETGKELSFADDDTRILAADTILHGSVSGFTPIEAIESVLATTSFEYDIDANRLIVGR